MLNRFITLFLVLTIFLGGSFTGQWVSQYTGWDAFAADETNALPVAKIQELAEVFEKIRQSYVEEVSADELMENALRGMVSSLDPHSAYLSEEDFSSFQRGLTGEEYGGVGTYIGQRDGWIEIISPIYNTPSSRAGLKSRDLILKIDDVSTQGMKVEDAVKKMRGKIGTILTLEVLSQSNDSPRRVELVREKIVTPSVVSASLGNQFAYLRITRFQDKTLNDLITNLNSLTDDNNVSGIILDLRDNPGGYLFAGIGVASIFLPVGTLIVSDKGRNNRKNEFVSQPDYYEGLKNHELLEKIPMVVLINNGSASAAEIVAGALQDHRRAVILGVPSYGKASVQSVIPLNSTRGKTKLRLTMARYYTPHERNIQALGITPDIRVNIAKPVSEEEEGFTLREQDLAGHLGNDDNEAQIENLKENDERPPFISENDFQYEQAVLVLKALNVTANRK